MAKIIYMGTPEFAVPPLIAMVSEGYEVSHIVTQPDKARDRGKRVQASPVKIAGEKMGIPILQPEKIKGNDEFMGRIEAESPDLIVVAAYGKILPTELLFMPKCGCINIHASLLPKYRGAAPIQRAIMEGEEKTGVTLMHMEEGLDTGDMIGFSETPILTKDAGQLHDELAEMGARLLIEMLPDILTGRAERIKQNEREATYAPMIYKKDGIVDFRRPAGEIERMIRGLYPWPTAYTFYKGNTMKLLKAKVMSYDGNAVPGTILSVSKEGVLVATGDDALLITVIQMSGKKPLEVAEYIKGNKIETWSLLG
ncbi:MAG: methionyl-tRNA formyltransferase [Anaerovoracaceae bacterium]